MITPENWSKLTNNVAEQLVAPAQALHPGVKDILQYVDHNIEYLAVNSTAPYGTETERAFDVPKPAHILQGVNRGLDYVTFVVPEEALALQALTRGTGRNGAELLRSVYHSIGELLGNLATRPDIKAPLIRTGDIAVDRLTGEVLLVPPLSFGKKVRTAEEYQNAFLSSIDKDINGFWPDDAVDFIKKEVVQGVEDGSREP